MQVNKSSAESVCDQKIREWLMKRQKHAPIRRKRTRARWIKKISNRSTPAKQCNTPKRSTNASRRSTRSSGLVCENLFSPTAPSMTSMPPVVKEVLKKKQTKQKVQRNKKKEKKQTIVEVC